MPPEGCSFSHGLSEPGLIVSSSSKRDKMLTKHHRMMPASRGSIWTECWVAWYEASEIDLLCEIELSRAKAAGDLKADPQ